MATQLQLRRGTTSQVAAFTGANGEVVVDTEKKTLFVNDGSTAGGLEIARADFSNISASATLTLATLNATTLNTTNLDLTNLEVTNIKAKDGTSAGSIADSTGVVTIASAVLTTADINAGTVDVSTVTAPTVTASTSLKTPLIEYTDGDDAITIADGGGVTIADLTATTADINGGTFDGIVGGTTPAAGSFTTLTISSSTDGDPVLGHFYNPNSGTGAESSVYITNSSTASDGLFLQALGASFTTADGFVQDGVTIGSGTGASGGLSIMTRAAADIRFYTNGHTNLAMTIDAKQSVGVGAAPNAGWSSDQTSGRVPVQIGFASMSGRLNDLHTEFSNNAYASGTGNDPQWAGMSRYAKQQMEFDSSGNILFKTAPTVEESTFSSSPNFSWLDRVKITGTETTFYPPSGSSMSGDIDIYGTNGSGYGGSVIARSRVTSFTDGTAYGSIMKFYTTNTSNVLTERVQVKSDGNVSIVDGNLIFADGHGIDFSNTPSGTGVSGASHLLHEYEEGEWTPAISSGSCAFSEARYTKIGRLVRFSYQVQGMDDITSNNHILVTGLPFPVKAGEAAGVAFGTYTNNASANVAYATTSESVYLYSMSSGTWDTMLHSELNSTSNYQYVAGSYQAEW